MLYLRICFDKQNSSELRAELLSSHRNYIAEFLSGQQGVKVVQGGPMSAGDLPGEDIGSFLVVEASSLEEVQRFHDADPFTRAQLFESAEVVRWDRHIGNPDQTEYTP